MQGARTKDRPMPIWGLVLMRMGGPFQTRKGREFCPRLRWKGLQTNQISGAFPPGREPNSASAEGMI